MNNSIQYDNNNMTNQQQPPTMFNQPQTMFNQPPTMFNQPSTYPNVGNNEIGANQQYNTMLLNGTNLDDELNYNSNSNQLNTSEQDSTLIKSVAREILNGLKENNMSLYDNSSINSYKNYNNQYYKNNNNNDNDNNNCRDNENETDDNNENLYKSSKKFKNSKIKNKVKEVVETIEDFVTDTKLINSTKTYSESAWWFFDEYFNKDFLVLFILYFILSQEMIKDFFAKYFTSLNPDNEGKIGVQGVIVYGLILTILYMIIKKLF
jgi:hypothetical protein